MNLKPMRNILQTKSRWIRYVDSGVSVYMLIVNGVYMFELTENVVLSSSWMRDKKRLLREVEQEKIYWTRMSNR